MAERIEGRCLCGSVKFNTGEIHHLDVCHCAICQRWTGGPFVGADFRNGDVVVTEDEGLTWYASSDWAKRGFCKTCGSSLFYRLNDAPDFWAICGGSLSLPDGMTIHQEIFIDEKPDYYSLAGDQPKLTGAEFMKTLEASSDD
jgi:hypothetical protein